MEHDVLGIPIPFDTFPMDPPNPREFWGEPVYNEEETTHFHRCRPADNSHSTLPVNILPTGNDTELNQQG
jgi:hypothetical protein